MLKILYQDPHIVVCLKPSGVSSQDGGVGSMPHLLMKKLEVGAVYPVHRLDKAVGGVMVYALSQKAAAELSRAVQERTLKKTYLAVLCGRPQKDADELSDLLFHDKFKNKTYVVDRMRKGVKDASLDYRVLEEADGKTLVQVNLHTGRTHQIRVQFASRKLPLVGDGRYGGKTADKELGLWSYQLIFSHPITKETMTFSHRPPEAVPWDRFLDMPEEDIF